MNSPGNRIEGACLSPDILKRIEDLPGQNPGDFGLQTSIRIKDVIARVWAGIISRRRWFIGTVNGRSCWMFGTRNKGRTQIR